MGQAPVASFREGFQKRADQGSSSGVVQVFCSLDGAGDEDDVLHVAGVDPHHAIHADRHFERQDASKALQHLAVRVQQPDKTSEAVCVGAR